MAAHDDDSASIGRESNESLASLDSGYPDRKADKELHPYARRCPQWPRSADAAQNSLHKTQHACMKKIVDHLMKQPEKINDVWNQLESGTVTTSSDFAQKKRLEDRCFVAVLVYCCGVGWCIIACGRLRSSCKCRTEMCNVVRGCWHVRAYCHVVVWGPHGR